MLGKSLLIQSRLGINQYTNMIEGLPNWINVLFLLTTGITILLFYFANGRKKSLLVLLIAWSIIQSALALSGFYQTTNTFPPRFIFVLLPTTILIVVGLLPKYKKRLVANRNRALSAFLHTIRIPVEIVLLYLFINKMVPELMTFEGRNFDILAGLSASIFPFVLLPAVIVPIVLYTHLTELMLLLKERGRQLVISQ